GEVVSGPVAYQRGRRRAGRPVRVRPAVAACRAVGHTPSGYPRAMRTSVMDVGSKTVRLVVADTADGVPLPVHTAKWRLRLCEQITPGRPLPEQGVDRLVEAVAAAGRTAAGGGAAGPLAFATAVVRGAPNRQEVLHEVRSRTAVALCTLPGEPEAELTFLGARRWMGWRSGPLALLDIG